MEKKLEVNQGDRYGRLTIVKEIEPYIQPSGAKKRQFECICDCGNITNKRLVEIKSGHTKSCGCFRKEITKKTKTKHGLSKHPLYSVWLGIIQRCEYENHNRFHNYGGDGITICDRWRYSFPNFLEDMGERPGPEYSIDRINPYGDYEPSNCRWATAKEQRNNQKIKGR